MPTKDELQEYGSNEMTATANVDGKELVYDKQGGGGWKEGMVCGAIVPVIQNNASVLSNRVRFSSLVEQWSLLIQEVATDIGFHYSPRMEIYKDRIYIRLEDVHNFHHMFDEKTRTYFPVLVPQPLQHFHMCSIPSVGELASWYRTEFEKSGVVLK